jgi:hypothetical protein
MSNIKTVINFHFHQKLILEEKIIFQYCLHQLLSSPQRLLTTPQRSLPSLFMRLSFLFRKHNDERPKSEAFP